MNEDLKKAFEEGGLWAKGLKIGDRFIGARPEADMRYPNFSNKVRALSLRARLFMLAALDELEKRIICTDDEGIITRYDPRS